MSLIKRNWTPEGRAKLSAALKARHATNRLLKESAEPTKSKAPTFTESVLSELRAKQDYYQPTHTEIDERGVILIKRGSQTAHAIKLRNRRFVVKQLNQAQRDINKLREAEDLSDSGVQEN